LVQLGAVDGVEASGTHTLNCLLQNLILESLRSWITGNLCIDINIWVNLFEGIKSIMQCVRCPVTIAVASETSNDASNSSEYIAHDGTFTFLGLAPGVPGPLNGFSPGSKVSCGLPWKPGVLGALARGLP